MRPPYLDVRLVALVALGGAVGTGLREGFALAFPASPTGFPLTIFVINVVGAFALGLLLETLTRRGADEGRRRIARLALGTGVLGGFTTYSSFATDVALRLGAATGVAFGYAAASILLGCLAAFAGIALAAALHARRARDGHGGDGHRDGGHGDGGHRDGGTAS